MKPSWRTRLFHIYFLFARPMTLGVRVVVGCPKQGVLLVRHTYVAGWHLPGGGVERDQTALQALTNELDEEAAIRPIGMPRLLAVLANRRASKRDHVLLYRCDEWEQIRAFSPTSEIAEIGFFELENLPEGTTQPTRDRLAEVFGDKPFSETW